MPIESLKTAWLVFGLFLLGFLDLGIRWVDVSIQKVCNSGIGLGIKLPDFWLWLGITGFLLFSLRERIRGNSKIERLAWTAVFLGGSTNAVDRFWRGCVTDYLYFPFFPSFNLADIILSLGVFILFFQYLRIFSQRESS